MKVAALIIGIDGWKKYTRPLIDSIKKHEPGCKLVVVDNASDPPYPAANKLVLRTGRLSYGAAINRAVKAAGKADWYIVLNNDVRCDGPFIDELPDTACIAGPTPKRLIGVNYIDAWLMAIHGDVWQEIGEWDENFVVSSYGDLDYCQRAVNAGYELVEAALPFTHLESRQRFGLPGFIESDRKNKQYFRSKHGV